MPTKIKIMLVEDNPEYRHVIQFAFKDDPAIELIDQFGTAELALRRLENKANLNVPDIVLLDLNLPRMSGLEALPWFQQHEQDIKTIILTQSTNEADIFSAIQKGASGYLLKSAGIEEITDAILSVANGEAFLDPSLSKYILKFVRKHPLELSISKKLSSRELEILTLLGDGLIKKEIADHLDISVNTVAKHITNVYEKLEVKNAPAAIHKAHRRGLFSSEN